MTATQTAAAPAAMTSPAARVPVNVHFAGRIGCAQFPYSCTATLSVLDRNEEVSDAWRPPSTDAWWGAASGGASTAATFDPEPLGGSSAAPPGPHRLVMSLLGSYDTPSYAPDGTRAFDLLGRCTADVEVEPGMGGLDVLVTFTPDEASFRAACTIETGSA